MKTLKKYYKVIIISAACTVFNGASHAFVAPIYNYSPPSFFVKNNILEIAALVSLFITFVLLGIVFTYIQNGLPGKKIGKGLRYGTSFGGIWFIGILGMSLFFDSPIEVELLVGGFDFVTIVLLGLLLGKFTASDNTHDVVEKDIKNIWSIFIIGFIYVIGRYLAYIMFDIELAYSTKFMGTLLWTSCIGLWMGFMYLLLKQSLNIYSPVKKAIIFGCIVFGINWVLYNLFAVILVDISPIELLIVAGSDILLLIVGIVLFEIFVEKIHKTQSLMSSIV